jgi:expansin (peptidoglycan-binding protein)
LGTSNNLQITCTNAMIPDLIPKSVLFNATALQGTIQHGAGFIGAALASPLLVFGGPAAVFTVCCLLYMGAGIQSLWIISNKTRQIGKLNTGNLFHPVIEGLVYIKVTRVLGLLIIMVGLHCLLTMG